MAALMESSMAGKLAAGLVSGMVEKKDVRLVAQRVV